MDTGMEGITLGKQLLAVEATNIFLGYRNAV
jgi:hypothetical protein